MATSAKALQQIKKKKWVQVFAPKILNEAFLGETFISEYEEAVGKEISVSLMTLTGEPQKQTVVLSFKMIGAKNNAITTDVIGFRIVPAAVRKTMRRGKEKIEDSFKLTTQDNVRVLIKPLLVTKGRTKSSVLANLRRTARAQVAKVVAATKFENLIYDLVTQKFQRSLSDMLRKIYPLSTCEVKYFSIVKDNKKGSAPIAPLNIAPAPAVPVAKDVQSAPEPAVASQ